MGYSHYFTQQKSVDINTWQKIKKDSMQILEYINKKYPQIQLVNNEPGEYIVNDQRISLNDKNNPHEDFYLPRNETGFNFCKTARKPYDLAVCSLLLIAEHYANDCYNISSDGNSQDWESAVNLNAIVLGYAFKLPKGLQDKYSQNIESVAQNIAQDLHHISKNHDAVTRFKF